MTTATATNVFSGLIPTYSAWAGTSHWRNRSFIHNL